MGRGGQLWRIGAVLILAYVVMYAAEPFTTTNARGANFSVTPPTPGITHQVIDSVAMVTVPAHCGAAIIDAWHAKQPDDSGWFGYAPLSETSIAVHGSCRNESRHRLGLSLVGVVTALGFVLAARWTERRPPLDSGPTYGPAT